MATSLPNILLLKHQHRKRHFQPIINQFQANYFYDETAERAKIDLVLISDEHDSETSGELAYYKAEQIPVLHIVDGILEWRNVWENPRSTNPEIGHPLFQPVLADKIACLGNAQARIMESWNNYGKCEVTGCARFDEYHALVASSIKRKRGEQKNILITTATNPAYTKKQLAVVVQSLQDLQVFFQVNKALGVQPIWRIAPFLEKHLPTLNNTFGKVSLLEQLQSADVLITTPSTLALEGMLFQIPVVMLDYTNVPQWLPTAWFINNKTHLDTIVESVLNPMPQRMQYQQLILQDQLQSKEAATPKIIELMKVMIACGKTARQQGKALALPYRILKNEPSLVDYDIASLNPNYTFFKNKQEKAELLVQISHLEHLVQLLKKQLILPVGFYELMEKIRFRIREFRRFK